MKHIGAQNNDAFEPSLNRFQLGTELQWWEKNRIEGCYNKIREIDESTPHKMKISKDYKVTFVKQM